MPSKDEAIVEAGNVRHIPAVARSPDASLSQGIDYDLKRGCEGVISECVNPICGPLRPWTNSVQDQRGTSKPTASPSASIAEELDKKFHLACEQDLRVSVARLRLYLEDDRTVSVLVSHIQDKIMEEYGAFRAASKPDFVLAKSKLKETLKAVCEG
jgi:hypothetical protein